MAVWACLTFARGAFWILLPFEHDKKEFPAPPSWPSVAAIVPARNEAESIGRAVAGLAWQDYPGSFSVLVVDDHSEDGTAAEAERAAKECKSRVPVSVVPAPQLAEGWAGKVWAMNAGIAAASTVAPDFYWFTDADIGHSPDTLRKLVSHAERDRVDLTSLMALLRAKAWPERMLVPAFLYFFLQLYPPKRIANPGSSTAGAAGGCVLLRREALERTGGLAAIRGEIIDDCALAREVKKSGGRLWLGVTHKSASLRGYEHFGAVRDMIARTAFTQLGYSSPQLLLTLAGLLVVYIVPVALVFSGDRTVSGLGFAAWVLQAATFLPFVRFFGLTTAWALSLPLAAIFYGYATWLSAFRHWRGRGGQWKGRAQAQVR